MENGLACCSWCAFSSHSEGRSDRDTWPRGKCNQQTNTSVNAIESPGTQNTRREQLVRCPGDAGEKRFNTTWGRPGGKYDWYVLREQMAYGLNESWRNIARAECFDNDTFKPFCPQDLREPDSRAHSDGQNGNPRGSFEKLKPFT